MDRINILGIDKFFRDNLSMMLSDITDNEERIASYWAMPRRVAVLCSLLNLVPDEDLRVILTHVLTHVPPETASKMITAISPDIASAIGFGGTVEQRRYSNAAGEHDAYVDKSDFSNFLRSGFLELAKENMNTAREEIKHLRIVIKELIELEPQDATPLGMVSVSFDDESWESQLHTFLQQADANEVLLRWSNYHLANTKLEHGGKCTSCMAGETFSAETDDQPCVAVTATCPVGQGYTATTTVRRDSSHGLHARAGVLRVKPLGV